MIGVARLAAQEEADVQQLDQIPGITWEEAVVPYQQQAAVPQRLSEATIQLWASGQPTSREREIFLQIIAIMDSKPGFNIRVDISSGIGSATQAIRFENEITNETIFSLYYSTTDVSTFEERIAPALCLGLD